MSKVSGIILLELLVTLMLSSFLLLLMGTFFLSAQRLTQQIQGRMTLQYNGILAWSLLQEVSKYAGFLGCTTSQTSLATQRISAKTALQIYDGQSLALPNTIRQNAQKKNMVLQARRMSLETVPVLANMQRGHQLHLEESFTIKPGAELIISDCQQATEFIAKVVTRQQGQLLITTTTNLSQYAAGARVGLYEEHYFYVAQASYTNQRGQTIDSLFEKINEQPAQEVVWGIRSLQLERINKQHPGQQPLLHVTFSSDSIESIGVKKTKLNDEGGHQQAMDEKQYQPWEGWFIIGGHR